MSKDDCTVILCHETRIERVIILLKWTVLDRKAFRISCKVLERSKRDLAGDMKR